MYVAISFPHRHQLATWWPEEPGKLMLTRHRSLSCKASTYCPTESRTQPHTLPPSVSDCTPLPAPHHLFPFLTSFADLETHHCQRG
ncbi:hypothetical protein ACFX15_041297 [Malus domestica]